MLTRRTAIGSGVALLGASVIGRAGAAGADPPPLVGEARGDDLHVMTYNIRVRHDTRPGEPDHWGDRAPLVARLLGVERPTLLGLQETTRSQLEAVTAALPGHRLLGYGFGTETMAGFPALAYDAERLQPLRVEQFCLSATPEDPDSTSWGSMFPRSAACVRFADRRTGRELLVLNTHLDHHSELARIRSAQVIRDRLAGADVPVVVTGDFNADLGGSLPQAVLTAEDAYAEAWSVAASRVTPAWGTFPDYAAAVVGGRRIDGVLVSPGVEVRRSAINSATFDTAAGPDRWPSDHLPVQALVRLV